MAPKIKLTYFEFRARGEIIRILLHYGGLQFEDKKIKREEWPEFKPSKSIGLPNLKSAKLHYEELFQRLSSASCQSWSGTGWF